MLKCSNDKPDKFLYETFRSLSSELDDLKAGISKVLLETPGEKRWIVEVAIDVFIKPDIAVIVRQMSLLKRMLSGKTEGLDVEAARNRNIFDVADMLGLEYKMRGGKGIALCPFHHEKTPSFTLFPDGHYHCFGCGRGGDTIDLYMGVTGVGFRQAVRELA